MNKTPQMPRLSGESRLFLDQEELLAISRGWSRAFRWGPAKASTPYTPDTTIFMLPVQRAPVQL